MPLTHITSAVVRTDSLKRPKLFDQLPADWRAGCQKLQEVHEPLPGRVADQMLNLAAVDFGLGFRDTEDVRSGTS